MFCYKCGKEVDDEAVVCIHCGCSTQKKEENSKKDNYSATGLGIVFGLFLGPIGLLGLLMYEKGSYARSTFISGCVWTFVITFVCSLIGIIITYTSASSMINSLFYY